MTEPLSDERLAEIRAAIKFAESYTREVVALMTDDALGLLSRLDKAEAGWQPIETAPKDGTAFMICRLGEPEKDYEIGYYYPYTTDQYVPVDGEPGLFRKVEQSIFDWAGFNNIHRATHWRPLPPPPSSES